VHVLTLPVLLLLLLVTNAALQIKNPSTVLSKAVHSLQTLHRLLVTGTPIQNNLKELWALMDWCCSGRLLGTYQVMLQSVH
jgi:SNF2 family DNA or RNA helicase